MDFVDFAYQDYKFMSVYKDDELFYDRSISLMSECIEKLLKQLIVDSTGKVPDKSHAHNRLLHVIVSESGFTHLKKYTSFCGLLSNIYFTRRYPSTDYYPLSKEEFEQYFSIGNKFIYDLVNSLTNKGKFKDEFRYKKQTIDMNLF